MQGVWWVWYLSMGGSVTDARSAAAAVYASTGVSALDARSAVGPRLVSVSTGGSVIDARSAVAVVSEIESQSEQEHHHQ